MDNLIVCADDFGLTNSVNRAIIDIHKIGNLNYTSLMVNMPGTKEAINLSKKYTSLNVGLHFNITEGISIVGKSTLTDENCKFFNRKTLIKKIFLNKIKKIDILNEFNEQIKVLKKNNIDTHTIDSHQHVHIIPYIFNIIYNELIKKNLSIRSCYTDMRYTKKKYKHILTNLLLYYKKNNEIFRNSNLTSVHHIGGIFEFNDYKNLKKIIKKNNVKPLELMIHPYINNKDLKFLYGKEYMSKINFFNTCFKEYEILSKKNIFELY
jgi:predicted glycoside hydrolase/deacetylase ChbG (UPF0249 family)